MAIRLSRKRVQPASVPETGQIITVRAPTLPGLPGQVEGQLKKQAGQELQELGNLALRVAADQKERDDKTAAGRAYLGFSNQMREIENKYYSRKGFQAQGSFDEYQQDVDKAFNDSMNGIDSSRAQELFDSISRSRRISSSSSLRTYERVQLDKAHLETSNALIEDSTQDAIENYNNPIAIMDARNKIIIGVGQTADLLGWSADQEKVALENAVSKMHSGVIQSMLIDNAGSAKDYMEANIEEIQGSDRIALEPKVKRYGVLQESQAIADEIHSEAVAKNLSLTDELALIKDKTTDADVRKQTETITRQKNRDDEFAETQAREDALSGFYAVLNDTAANITVKTNSANSIENEGDRNNALGMIRTQQSQALAFQKQQVEKETIAHTFEAKNLIDSRGITNEGQLFSGYYNKVNRTDFQFLQTYLRQGGRIGNLNPSSYNTPFKDLIGDIDDNKKLYLATVGYIRDQVEGGIEPTPDRINQWVINAATAGEEIEGVLYFDNLTFAKALEEGVDKQWLPKILDSEDADIIKAMKDWNKNNATQPQKKIDEFNKRLWKRVFIMNLPPPDPSIKDVF